MPEQFNIYCDESCHLENDQKKAMVLGAVWCPVDKRLEIAQRLREIKARHGMSQEFEVKWTKVSGSKVDFYIDYLDYFFDDDDLHFRGLVIPNKNELHHEQYSQDHDTWYYKMYFNMLKIILLPEAQYFIYIDVKDTQGARKVEKLHDVLCNNAYDFNRNIIRRMQQVHSHEIEQLQLADLLIGALAYIHRDLQGNSGKEKLIERIKQRSSCSLLQSTLTRATKFNLFIWQAGGRNGL